MVRKAFSRKLLGQLPIGNHSKKKGLGYMIEAIAAMVTVFVFVIGNTASPPPQEWSPYQKKITSSDLGHTLKQTGDLNQMIRRRETGSLETAFESLSSGKLQVTGTVKDIPLDKQYIGFHIIPEKRHTISTESVKSRCSGDLEEIESEEPVLRSEKRHGSVLYFADVDPQIAGGGNNQPDYDSLWVDNGTSCQFSAAEGPFYIDEFFWWGDSGTGEYYEFKNISDDGNEFRFFNATKVIRLKKTINKPLNGIRTRQKFNTFAYEETNIEIYNTVVFQRRKALKQINTDKEKLKNFMSSGTALFLMNLEKNDLDSGYMADTGFAWADLKAGASSKATNCKTYGPVKIENDCTYGPGIYHLENLTVESGATVNIENKPRRCETGYRKDGCENTPYSQHAPKIVVEGDVEINGEINADFEGFSNASSTADTGGPGAGEEGTTAGGGAYGGDGGNSDGGSSGGPSYGDSSNAKRLGSAGGYDTDNPGEGGSGGGSVWLVSNQSIEFDGEINADGETGQGGAGGGSGGSIRLEADRFTGSGSLTVNGGDSGNRGGGGSGGRIFIRRQSGSIPYSTSASGGTSGGGGETGDDGTIVKATEQFTVTLGPDENIDFINSQASDRVETYFKATDGEKSGVRLPPDKAVSNSSGSLMSEDILLKASDASYYTDTWNATNYSMDPVKPSEIGNEVEEFPDSACIDTAEASQNMTIGTFEFPGGEEYTVLNTEMGVDRDFCKNHAVRSLSIDMDGDGDFTEENEGPLLNGETLKITNRDYQVRTLTESGNRKKGEGAEFVFAGNNELPLVKHRSSFQGFRGTKMALAPYQESYSEDERKIISATVYWLLGDEEEFGEEETTTFSTEVHGSVTENTYMPYTLALRWK